MSADRVPDYVMVPREPTLEMVRVGYITYTDRNDTQRPFETMRQVYQCMLAAAPSPWISVEEQPKQTERDAEERR